jgi:hypothetical protein
MGSDNRGNKKISLAENPFLCTLYCRVLCIEYSYDMYAVFQGYSTIVFRILRIHFLHKNMLDT